MAPAAMRKSKRDREEHGNGPSEPSPEQERESSPVAPSAENCQVTEEPVINHETGKKYMKAVKATFKDDAESYQKFLELMQDVRRKQVDHAGLGNRVKELFRGHTNLILGFNMFLPEEHRITLPSMEPPGFLMKSQNGKSQYREYCETLAMYMKQSVPVDYAYKLAETLFADRNRNRNEIIADFRAFLPILEGSISESPTQEPDQQPALTRRRVKVVHPSANVRDNEAPGKSGRRARRGKEKMEATNSLEVERKLKERTSNSREEARTESTQACQPARMSASNATRRQHVLTAPRNAAAAGSPRPASRAASNQRVPARTAAKRQSLLPNEDAHEDTNAPPSPPPPPLPSIAELQERLRNVTKCRPDCKACEPVEYPIFDWQAEDPEYYAKGKANRERERQALIARGVPGSFNDS